MSISSLLISLADIDIKRVKKNQIGSFEDWLKFNRKSLIKKYTKEFNEKKKIELPISFEDKVSKLMGEHPLHHLSRRHCLTLFSQYYLIDVRNYHNSDLVILNILNRLYKVTDLKFNHYFLNNYEKKFIFSMVEERDIKNLEKHTFKIEMERMLSNNKQDKKKVNKI